MIRVFLAAFLLTVFALHAEPVRVLTSFAPLDSLTRNVVGDAATVEMLLPPGVGPHDYAITPGDLKKIAEADVIILNGLGLEAWLGKAITNSARKDAVVVDTSTGIPPITEVTQIGGHSHAHNHDHGDANPHIWLDPVLAKLQVEAITRAMVARDAANAEIYKTNAVAYLAKLDALDADYKALAATLPNKKLITFHDAFVYLAKQYGFELIGVFQPFPGKEPTPKYLTQLKNVIEANDVKVLFAEPQYEPRVMRTLAEDLGLAIATLDTLEVGEPDAGLYEKVMRANLESLRTALDVARP